MIYFLPTIHSDLAGFQALGALAQATTDLNRDRLRLNLSQCTFFEANMSAPLGAVLAAIEKRYNTVKITDVPGAIEVILRKNGLLSAYGYSALPDSNRTTLPFERFKLTEATRFSDYLQDYVQGKGIPTMSKGLRQSFRMSILEVFENAAAHSESATGIFVCGQFFPQKQRLDITIADAGVSIRANVRRHLRLQVLSSVAAIRWALGEGNTTKTGNKPGGLGLKLLQEFIGLNGGKIQMASCRGFYQFARGTDQLVQMSSELIGTTVNLEINTADANSYQLQSEISPEDIF